jgi:1-deoxyxylulose-5-phosphate synthase
MQYTRLGRTGLKISTYIMGGDNFGGQTDEAAALRMMASATDAGVNVIDTANTYTDGHSEEIVGKFLKGRREQTVLATKCRYPTGPGIFDSGASRKAIMKAIDESLRRLQTDYIDLYQLHAFDPEAPLDESLGALDDLVHQGKVRYIGCSNFSGAQLTQGLRISSARGLARFDSTQPRYNLLYRHPEYELLPAAREFGVGVIIYSPMAGGFLTGKQKRDGGIEGGRYDPNNRTWGFYSSTYWHESRFEAAERFVAVCDRFGLSPYQLGIGWALSNPAVSACIVGARTPEQLEMNLAGWDTEIQSDAIAAASEIGDWARDNGPRIV